MVNKYMKGCPTSLVGKFKSNDDKIHFTQKIVATIKDEQNQVLVRIWRNWKDIGMGKKSAVNLEKYSSSSKC